MQRVDDPGATSLALAWCRPTDLTATTAASDQCTGLWIGGDPVNELLTLLVFPDLGGVALDDLSFGNGAHTVSIRRCRSTGKAFWVSRARRVP